MRCSDLPDVQLIRSSLEPSGKINIPNVYLVSIATTLRLMDFTVFSLAYNDIKESFFPETVVATFLCV